MVTAVSAQMNSDELALRLNQQALVANFGLFALLPGPFDRLLIEACKVAAEGLGTKYSKVLRYRSTVNDFLVVAGRGWHAGVVGNSTLGSGLDSPAGYAMHTGLPTMSNHLAEEQRFRVPALLAEHGIQSAINVMIGDVSGEPFGVLEVDSSRRHEFVQADTAFLQALANVLAAGLARVEFEVAKDDLLRDKDLLMREVHHRVKNSLQLVRTMLGLQGRGASDETRHELDNAAGRIMSIASVHQRLYEGGSVTEGDADLYLKGLLGDMEAMFGDASNGRSIALDCEALLLPADNLTPLGLIVSELVTNAIKYGEGRVLVTVRRIATGLQVSVDDEGPGFATEEVGKGGLGMRLVSALAKGAAAQAIEVDRTVGHGRVVVRMVI